MAGNEWKEGGMQRSDPPLLCDGVTREAERAEN